MSSGRAFVIYTTLRIVLLLIVAGVLYLLGARGLLLIALAFLASGALSLVLLNNSRSKASQGLGRMIGRINDRIDAAAAKEDPVDDHDPEPSEPALGDDQTEQGSQGQADSESQTGQQQSQ